MHKPNAPDAQRLVVVSGCSCGGKTSLLAEMARRGHATQPEPGQAIITEQLASGGEGLPWVNERKFVDLCVVRALRLYRSARASRATTLFDRSLLDNLAALVRRGAPIPGHWARAIGRYRYSQRVYLVPPWRALFDRAERQHTFGEAVAEYESLLEFYPEHGYEIVLIPRGTIAERADWLAMQMQSRI